MQLDCVKGGIERLEERESCAFSHFFVRRNVMKENFIGLLLDETRLSKKRRMRK